MSELYPFSVRTWEEIYRILRAHAEAARGVERVTEHGALTVAVPRTTGADAFAISLVFDERIYGLSSTQLIDRWVRDATQLARMRDEDESNIYAGNETFWNTVAEAAIALDREGRPLPPAEVVREALEALRAQRSSYPRTADPAPRVAEPRTETAGSTSPLGGARTEFATVLSAPSAQEMAVRQLTFFGALRGWQSERNRMRFVPCTRNSDVLALVDYWTDLVNRHSWGERSTAEAAIYAGWHRVAEQTRVAAQRPPHEPYERNWEFWITLLLLATQTELRDARPAPWMFHGPAMRDAPRNADPYRDFQAYSQTLKRVFGQLRGEDRVTGRHIATVPRTRVYDVKLLATYWHSQLLAQGGVNFADRSARATIERWRAAYTDVVDITSTLDVTAVYPKNVDFWEAVMAIGVQLGVTREAPTQADLLQGAFEKSAGNLPDTAVHVARTVAGAGADAAHAVVGGVKKVLGGAADAVKEIADRYLTRPLLYLGLGLGGVGLLAILFLRPPAPGRASNEP